MKLINRSPLRIAAVALVVFFLTRLGLTGFELLKDGLSAVPLTQLPRILAKGMLFDLATAVYVLIPLMVYEVLLPNRWRASRVHAPLRFIAVALVIGILLFGAVSEFTFWLEFSTRLNFIAVDYLLYTKEVIGNIRESYPVGWIFAVIGILAVGVTVLQWSAIRASDQHPYSLREKLGYAMGLSLLVVGVGASLSVDQMEGSGNAYVDELSGNGVYSFAAALRRNELDYDKFYKTMDAHAADALLARLGVKRPALSSGVTSARATPGTLSAQMPKAPKNIVMISIESMSASFMDTYGATKGLTPQMDALARQGLMFKHFYATGTRTVRGLEALSLGTPPVPGQAIVRRPNNEHLSTIGELLKAQGFSTHFVYGGYGYFDNMNAYFSANDYIINDRTDIPKNDIAHENVWGVADESLFNQTIRVIDQLRSTTQTRDKPNGKPFFIHVMTTSNHRPFTYPDGRIDIPSPGGRDGAVKYTDYAIGKFIRDSQSKPWFKDTLFVITADHCASAAGKTKLPVQNYHIPLIFYAPALVKPGVFDRMVSQIDLPPTLLKVLRMKGDELFYGQSFFEQTDQDQRVFVSNYQELGYYKQGILTVLSPRRQVAAFTVDPQTFVSTPTTPDAQLVDEAIAYYQTASRAFKTGKLKAPGFTANP